MTGIRNRRKLSFWSALPAYLGGKRRLCPLIFREMDRVVPRRRWPEMTFLDAFLGGGSVSLYAKAQNFGRVVACDISERSAIVGRALIANSRVRLARADILRILAHRAAEPGPVERRYVPSVFTPNVAQFLDAAMATAATTTDVAKANLIKLMAIKIALMAHPMSLVRPGTVKRIVEGDYEIVSERCVDSYIKALRLTTPDRLWRIAESINAGVFEGRGEVHKADIVDILPDIQAGVAYFDPPYPGTASYEKSYRYLDEILGDDIRPVSAFSHLDGVSQIDRVLERARHIPVWVISFGNAVATLDDLEFRVARMKRHVRAIEIPYVHRASVASEEKKRTNREYLLVGVDPDAEIVRSGSFQIEGGRERCLNSA